MKNIILIIALLVSFVWSQDVFAKAAKKKPALVGLKHSKHSPKAHPKKALSSKSKPIKKQVKASAKKKNQVAKKTKHRQVSSVTKKSKNKKSVAKKPHRRKRNY